MRRAPSALLALTNAKQEAPAATAKPSLKGTAFRSTLAAIERLHGAKGLAVVKERLPADVSDALGQILPVSWYPVSLGAELHAAVRDTLGAGSWEESRAIGREAARIDYTGVYRLVLRAAQYDTVFSRLELVWKNYSTQGAFVWERTGPGSMRATVSDVRGFNEGMWIACAGRTETLLTLTGARTADVAVTTRGERQCTFEALWIA